MTSRRRLAVAAALALGVPTAAAAQGVGEDAVRKLAGCYALEIGEWTVDWEPGPLPSRLDLLSEIRPGASATGIVETTGGSPPPEVRRARSVDERGGPVHGFERWTRLGPASFRVSGGPLARVDLLFVRSEREGYRGFAVPRRPEMDAGRSGRRPQAPILARPVPCDL